MEGTAKKDRLRKWLLPVLGVCLAVSVAVNVCQAFGGAGTRQARGTYITPQEFYSRDYGRGAAWVVLTEDQFYLYDGLTQELVEEGEYRTSEDGQYIDLEVDGVPYMQAALEDGILYLTHPDGTGVVMAQHVENHYVFPGAYPDSFAPDGI